MTAPHSMTGVGAARAVTELGELRVELRSLNGKHLAIKLRLADGLSGYEAALEELARSRFARGTVVLTLERTTPTASALDAAAVRLAAHQLQELARELGLPPPSLADVLASLSSSRSSSVARSLPEQVRAVVLRACEELARSRVQEGSAIAAACTSLLDEFEQQLATARARAPELAAKYRERLLERVREFVALHAPGALPADELVREVALYAERVDVAEELHRLDLHLAEIRRTLASGGEIGKRLEFLLQELLRETNTMGSKSPDVVVAHAVVAMKTSIDRLKEQAANLQ